MAIQSNTPNGGFLKAYHLLPAGKFTRVKEEIKKQCDWASDSTFYSKARGSRAIKNPEWRVLEEIFRSHGIDVHTGKTLQVA